MSTKTAFKRVALIAAAALAIGGISAVSANAAAGPQINSSAVSSTATNVTGTYTVESFTAGTADNYYTISTSGVGSVNYPTASSSTTLTATGAGEVWSNSTGAIGTGSNFTTADKLSVSVFSAVAGTQTVSIKGNVSDAITLTITWGVAAGTVYNHSTAFLSSTTTSQALVDSAAISTSATAGATVARLSVSQYSSADTATAMTTAASTAVTVAITGAGSVDTSSTGGSRGPSVTYPAGTSPAGVSDFYVFPNGVSGVGTITVTVNGVVASTKTVTFVGSLAKYLLTAANTQKTDIGVGSTGTLTITGVDAVGNAIATPAIAAVTSSDPTIATVTFAGNVVTVTGVKSGTANITIANLTSAPTITLVVPVVITKATAAKITLAFDAASYAEGTKATITLTATDSNGSPVADGTYNLLGATGISPNLALIGSTLPTTAAVTLVGGVATYTAYVPSAAATLTLTAVEGATTDDVIAGTTAATITASADITSATADAVQAAVDASNEATDAANAATDAANAAADSADAATQAAQDAGAQATAALAATVVLTQQVSKIFLSMHKLSALLVRLIHKVHA